MKQIVNYKEEENNAEIIAIIQCKAYKNGTREIK